MAENKKVSDEDAATTLTGTEVVRVVQSGNSRRTTAQEIANLGGSTGGDIAAKVLAFTPALRRALTSKRNLPGTSLNLMYSVYEAAKKTNTDGGISVWEPDGVSFYGSMYIRDTAMAMEGYLEYFTPAQISAVFLYYLGKCNLMTGEVPDHVTHTGTVFMAPAPTGRGSRAPIDGQAMLLQLAWLYYVATGDATLYGAHAAAMKGLIETGITYNPTTKAVTISDALPYVGFGFYDSCIITGDNSFSTIQTYRAYQMLTELELALGNTTEAIRLYNRAQDMKKAIQGMLVVRAGAGAELASPYNAKQMAYLPASTIRGAGQIDLWATAYAVWSGILTEAQDKAAANFLYYAANATTSNVKNGGLRHVYKLSDYTANTACWQSYYYTPNYGEYQNGAYWATAYPWLLHALTKVAPVYAQSLWTVYSAYQLGITNGPSEWTSPGGVQGALKYLTSAVPMVSVGDMPLIQSSSSSGGGGAAGIAWASTRPTPGGGDIMVAITSTYVDSGIGTVTIPAVAGDNLKIMVSGTCYQLTASGQIGMGLFCGTHAAQEAEIFPSNSTRPDSFTMFGEYVVQASDITSGNVTVSLKVLCTAATYIVNTAPAGVTTYGPRLRVENWSH